MFEKSAVNPFLKEYLEAFALDDPEVSGKVHERGILETMTSFFSAVGRGHFNELLGFFHEDVVVRIVAPDSFGFLTKAEGPHQAGSLISANFKSLTDQKFEMLEVICQGNKICSRSLNYGRVVATNEEFCLEVALFITIRDGRISRLNQYMNPRLP